jgi:hypothetical protein
MLNFYAIIISYCFICITYCITYCITLFEIVEEMTPTDTEAPQTKIQDRTVSNLMLDGPYMVDMYIEDL